MTEEPTDEELLARLRSDPAALELIFAVTSASLAKLQPVIPPGAAENPALAPDPRSGP